MGMLVMAEPLMCPFEPNSINHDLISWPVYLLELGGLRGRPARVWVQFQVHSSWMLDYYLLGDTCTQSYPYNLP
jgi:hypothetical protein